VRRPRRRRKMRKRLLMMIWVSVSLIRRTDSFGVGVIGRVYLC
jgi:hypothetical protein